MYEYNSKILRVVDGDTVDVDIDLGFGVWLHRQRVRVAGIDAPESRTRDKLEKQFGLAAKQRVKDYCPIGSMRVLVTKEYDATDKFGRILGDFIVEQDDVGTPIMLTEKMVSEGHAVAYFGGSKEEIQLKHEANRAKLLREGVVVLDENNT